VECDAGSSLCGWDIEEPNGVFEKTWKRKRA
jgi:hypothetical protein